MPPITPNPFLGIGLHAIGAFMSSICYAPQKGVRNWSWATFWIAQAWWCWLILPLLGAWATIPDLGEVISETPLSVQLTGLAIGMFYGIGGTTFNISIRYIGFSLTYAIAVGLSGILGTVIPPLFKGQVAMLMAKPGAGVVLSGILIGILGIVVCGLVGRMKERHLRTQDSQSQFSMVTGLLLSLTAGVCSATYGIGIDVLQPAIDAAERHGANYWKGNIAYIYLNTGAFVTSLIYCLWIQRQKPWASELISAPAEGGGVRLTLNHFLALGTGVLWYGQFFFYNLGHVRMGSFSFTSWGIHMIMLVLFSNALAVILGEWKGCTPRIRFGISFGLSILMIAVSLLTWGNYLGEQTSGH